MPSWRKVAFSNSSPRLLLPRLSSIEVGTIKAADGKTDLYYRLIKPTDFDPAKKYPAATVVEAEHDVAFVCHVDVPAAGIVHPAVRYHVDGERIGVHGWSFGGHMTTALMLRYPEIFKVGVAGGPVIDWGYYEIMYGERYMDTPQANPEGYKQTNLKNLAGNLKGHLLIIHDDHDDTCVPQHTLSFMKACVDARTYPDLFIYPTHKHNVLGRDRVHLHEKITRYFEEYL